MHIKVRILFAAILIGSVAHAADEPAKLTFDYPVDVATPTREGLTNQVTVPAGQPVMLEREKFAWIQAKGKIPMLIVPHLPSDADTAKMQLPDVAAWPSELTAQEIDRKVSSMITDITSFQAAIRKRDVKEAEKVLSRLEATQNISYLLFLRATLDFVRGDINSARINVKRGLQRDPANEQGLGLLKAIGEKQP